MSKYPIIIDRDTARFIKNLKEYLNSLEERSSKLRYDASMFAKYCNQDGLSKRLAKQLEDGAQACDKMHEIGSEMLKKLEGRTDD